ncbi:hypothetical protein HPB48_001402 [Haemaphysalis longicornis]|uniref:DDE Tnp4 domain-containing protein n=1 Tax=Haemaphysalis longicornis TaxID=44386 RepID=A0A9J6G9B9_HAELO|nr:hypothetical protein HPB48_001402 [Haemaphysalis longicornis]
MGATSPSLMKSGSATDYHNYKGWYSIILLALVDHKYRFRFVNVGAPGRCHDSHAYQLSKLRHVKEETLSGAHLPPCSFPKVQKTFDHMCHLVGLRSNVKATPLERIAHTML